MTPCNGVIPCPDYLASGTGGIKQAVHVDRHSAAHGRITTVTTVESPAGEQRNSARWRCNGSIATVNVAGLGILRLGAFLYFGR